MNFDIFFATGTSARPARRRAYSGIISAKMNVLLKTAAILLASLLVAPPAAAQAGKPPADGTVVAGEVGKRLERAVAEASKDFWGAVLVAQGGKVTLAKGYGGALDVIEYGWNWANRGATGVVTTVHDLLRWDQALRGTKVLPKAALAKLYRPEKSGYAYGWEVGQTRRKTAFARHGGATRGFGAYYLRLLDENVVIAVVGARSDEAQKIAERLEATLFPGK